ncbi:MAG: DUF3237 domain-containing protein [Rhodospirillaceae bacterium]|nr:DUF3237 domain-containing protein [Rhodospirillaceae bacterium]
MLPLPGFQPMAGLVPALVIDVLLGPEQDLGRVAAGRRTDYPIAGGTFVAVDPEGGHQAGRVLPGGADHFLLRDDGIGVLDAAYRLEADDGTVIRIHNRGLWIPNAAGEEPRADELYCRCAPVFEAPAGAFAWLSAHVFAGRVDYPAPGRVLVSCCRLL